MKQIKKRGFTLVELVIVIAVIAILAAVLIPTFITVIDNANNSADLQLVRNMNTVLSTNLEIKENATAENLRKLLKDNGLESKDLVTKNDDMVIVYNKDKNQFERMNLKKTLGGSDIVIASAAGDNVLAESPYAPEEIFEGYIITSTGGNSFAEALYSLHTIADQTFSMTNFFKKLGTNADVLEKVARIVQTTAFVVPAEDGPQLISFGIKQSGNTWIENNESKISPTHVVFNENVAEVDIGIFQEYTNLTVILPDTVETVTHKGGPTDPLNNTVQFAGNLDALNQLSEDDVVRNNVLKGTLDEAKEGVAKFGGDLTQLYFYVSSTVTQDATKYYYSTLDAAIAQASITAYYSGKEKTVVLTDATTTIDEALTIPKNVTLSVPFAGDETNGYYLGAAYSGDKAQSTTGTTKNFTGEKSIVDDDLKTVEGTAYAITTDYKTHTLNVNADLIIEGKLEVGGVTSHDGQYYQGHTSGNYAQVNIAKGSTITVNEGGMLETYGYVKGGSVVALEGADLLEPFIVTDYTGGSNTVSLYFGGQSPFLRYAMLNIQSKLTVNYGAKLWAHCNLYTGAGYNLTDEVVIGYGERTSQTKGLITLGEGASAVCSYEYKPEYAVKDADDTAGNNNLAGDIGRTTVQIYGNARTEALSLLGLVTTANVLFPVPYNFHFIIEENAGFDIYNHYIILPGAEVTVRGVLKVTPNASFFVMDYLTQGAGMETKKYPTAAQLNNDTSKLSTSAVFTLSGEFNVAGNTHVGGVVRADGENAKIVVAQNADVSGVYNVGGVGTYSANTSSYAFPLRVFDVDSADMADYKNSGDNTLKLAKVAAGSTYEAQAHTASLSETTNCTYYKIPDSGDAEPQFNAAGKTYVKKEDTGTLTFSANYGFTQTEGYEAQVNAFPIKENFSELPSTFAEAKAAIDAYYELSPKARQLVNDTGFAISSYLEGAVTNLFKSETAYKNAFETASESLGQLDIALAATAAWNELASLSAYVKPLIAADVQQTLEELHKESKNIILFTISYENNTGVSYPATIANKEADGDPVSLAPYTKTEGTTTTVYFTLDLAPAAVTMKDTSGKEYGTTDPAGTLFYEAWRNFVSDTTRSSAVQNTDVKIVLYTDIGLWQTKSFTANEDTKTAWGNFQHTKQAGNSTNYYFIQNLRMYSGKVSLDLNDNTVHLLVNKDSHNGDVDGFSNHIYNSNNAALTIMNGTIDAKGEKEDIGIGGSDREYYFIEAKGPLTMENVVLNTAEQQTGLTTDGIKVKYVVGSKIGGPESCGDATIKNVTINGMGARRGIKIEGGYANIQDTTIDANIGIEITGMGKKGEEIEQKNVSLKNCTINGATRAINIASTTNARIVSIEDCKLASRSRSGQALNISASNGKVQIDSIKDSSFASAGTAIQSQGTSSNQVQIGTIEGCTITGDKLLDTSGTYVDVYGLKLEYTTVGTMKNCTVVASADSSMLGTAVSLGTGSSLHLVCAGEDNNWFAAFGSDKSVLFSGAGIVTVQVGTGSPSDGVSADEFDISNTPANFSRETEFHGGYDCYKLVIPKESA